MAGGWEEDRQGVCVGGLKVFWCGFYGEKIQIIQNLIGNHRKPSRNQHETIQKLIGNHRKP